MKNFKIDIKGVDKLLEKEVIERMKKANEFMYNQIGENMPEDTKNLTRQTKIEHIEKKGSKIIGTVSNNEDYMVYVEYGVKGKTYNYYKNGGRRKGADPFYTGVGARPFTKTYDNQDNINEVNKIFNK